MPIRTRTKARTTRKTSTKKKVKPRKARTSLTGPVLNLLNLGAGPVNGLKVRVFSDAPITGAYRH